MGKTKNKELPTDQVDIVSEEVEVEEPLKEDAPQEDAPPVNKTIKKGVVLNCSYLRIRANPNLNGKEIGLLPKNEIVQIIVEDSTKSFYAVELKPNGIGFCMKTFIDLI